MLDQFKIDWFCDMNAALHDELDTEAFVARVDANVARMRWLACELLQRARARHPAIDDHGLDALLASDAPPPSLAPVWYADAA